MTTPTAAYDALRLERHDTPLPGVTAADWARMSWRHRDQYRRNLWLRLEATERPAPREPEPIICGPYSLISAAARHRQEQEALADLREMVALAATVITETHETRLMPHGTRAAQERHRARGEEPCIACATDARHKVLPGDADEFARRRLAGQSYRTIGAATGYDHSTVRKYLMRMTHQPSNREKAAA